MTKIKNNALLQAISGKMGETHSYRKVRGKMYMVNLPEKGNTLRDDQKTFITRFQRGVNYAKLQMEDPLAKEMYQKGITPRKHSAYLVALSDRLNAPQVHEIKVAEYNGAIGDSIVIDATDDFKVTRVRVTISDPDGTKVEQGFAVQDAKVPERWVYTTTEANPSAKGSTISVTAFDTPQNETTLEKVV